MLSGLGADSKMWKLPRSIFQNPNFHFRNASTAATEASRHAVPPPQVPSRADVVIIGGGSAGCHTLYHLAKRGINAVLLERAKLTAGTTWHTAGLLWRLRPNDVDIQLLSNSRNMLQQLEAETGLDPGWIQNGGIFIAHTERRLEEYRRLATIGNALGIENYMLDPKEAQKIFPALDTEAFIGALYSPGDGVVDPAMLCSALARAATKNGCQVIENCAVNDLLIESRNGSKHIIGVKTSYGDIRAGTVVNATGVWGRDLVARHGTKLPLVPMKHSYIVTESIPGVRGTPNVRDHDFSTYFRIQGDAICMGGYEANPIILDQVAEDFHFGLYELDWSVFESLFKGALKLSPTLGQYGVKTTICGPESFTPDHKPLMGPDPKIRGLYHNCGFNSSGMMFGGGCGEQTALWIINGQPELPMFGFDLRRFSEQQCAAPQWIEERSHESYAKNYSLVFKNDQPLAGRNFQKDALHDLLVAQGAFMEERQGWERPAFFLRNEQAPVLPYDWYGSYGHARQQDSAYERVLEGDLIYSTHSQYHELIGAEALACRNNAVLFNLCYFCKMILEGPQAKEAADWLFTANTNREAGKIVYTCALNDAGGVEADLTITRLADAGGYYIIAGGASAYYTYNTLAKELESKGFAATLRDISAEVGIISIQGPKSRAILQQVTDCALTNDGLPVNSMTEAKCGGIDVRLLRVSFVGELGYELHMPVRNCAEVYKTLMAAGAGYGLSNAGYRALYALSNEKGYHLWGYDLRTNDTPLEAGLGFTCRRTGDFKGKSALEKQRKMGVKQRMVCLLLNEDVPLWGLEGIYRDGVPVGFVNRAEYAYRLRKSMVHAYIKHAEDATIDSDYILSGSYEIDVMGKRQKAECLLRSPFDPEGKRILGLYI